MGDLIENVLKQHALETPNYFDPICKNRRSHLTKIQCYVVHNLIMCGKTNSRKNGHLRLKDLNNVKQNYFALGI